MWWLQFFAQAWEPTNGHRILEFYLKALIKQLWHIHLLGQPHHLWLRKFWSLKTLGPRERRKLREKINQSINHSLLALFSDSSQGTYCWPPSVRVNRSGCKRKDYHLSSVDESSIFFWFLQVINKDTRAFSSFHPLSPQVTIQIPVSPSKILWIPLPRHNRVLPSGTREIRKTPTIS